jgi:hypothetical protein
VVIWLVVLVMARGQLNLGVTRSKLSPRGRFVGAYACFALILGQVGATVALNLDKQSWRQAHLTTASVVGIAISGLIGAALGYLLGSQEPPEAPSRDTPLGRTLPDPSPSEIVRRWHSPTHWDDHAADG